ncbi:hypothetical protein [Paenibacillus roseipurpureus]|uniref:Uncharacterized protein n=1 Tax=Paenibacillus roseopurpureus TaxID=2918901 RepID=A0AA96LM81_9BACL|nr:hypothetical protein [Paenibacillus sp. MBLB1832]WNR43662.1 hypothetical protein MJB10_21555 [Paenibacillus sp. MBLB1832]
MRKKLKILAVITIIIISLGIGINSYFDLGFRTLKYYTTTSSDLTNENISGVKLNQSIKSEEFLSNVGELKSQDNALFDYYQSNKGMVVVTEKNDDKIIRIFTYSSDFKTDNGISIRNDSKDFKTNKGISLGNDLNTILEQYGYQYYERFEQGSMIIGYIDKRNKRTLEFCMIDNKVYSIRLDKSIMY